MADYAYCHNDPINKVDALGLASVIVNGIGVTGVGLGDDVGNSLIGSKARSPEMVTAINLFAQADAIRRYDKAAVAFERELNRGTLFGDIPVFTKALMGRGNHPITREKTVAKMVAERIPRGVDPAMYHLVAKDFLAASAKAWDAHEAYWDKINKLQNSPGYRLREIARETVNLPGHFAAFAFSAAMATDVTTGNAVVFNGWSEGFGLHEVSAGERSFATALTLLPVTRVGSFGDDLYRFGSTGRRLSTSAPLFSRAAGDAMGADELARIKMAFARNGGIIDQGADAQAYLRLQGAEGVTFGADTILLRPNPSRSSVFEELIHTAQNRTGRFTGDNVLQMEIEAAEKLIRFRRAYGIPNSETRATIERLRAMRIELGE